MSNPTTRENGQLMVHYLHETLLAAKAKHFKSMEHYMRKRARKILGKRDLDFDVKIHPHVIIIPHQPVPPTSEDNLN